MSSRPRKVKPARQKVKGGTRTTKSGKLLVEQLADTTARLLGAEDALSEKISEITSADAVKEAPKQDFVASSAVDKGQQGALRDVMSRKEVVVQVGEAATEVEEVETNWAHFDGLIRLALLADNFSEVVVLRVRKQLGPYMVRADIMPNERNVLRAVERFDMVANSIKDGLTYQSHSLLRWFHQFKLHNPFRWAMLKIVAPVLGLTTILLSTKVSVRARRVTQLVGFGLMTHWALGLLRKTPAKPVQYVVPVVTDLCTGNRYTRLRLHENAKVKIPVMFKCIERSYYQVFTVKGAVVNCARNCTHNELMALHSRMLIPSYHNDVKEADNLWIDATCEFKKQLEHRLNLIVNLVGNTVEELAAFVTKYSAGRAKQVLNAYENWMVSGMATTNSETRGFVKREWLNKDADKFKPRFISGKTDEYLGQTAPAYHALQKALAELCFNQSSDWFYSGGRTAEEVGAWAYNLEQAGYKFLENDFSAYDGHTEDYAIAAEMSFYERLLPDFTLDALRRQNRCDGRTGSGVKFSCRGKFCSGVINTSMGNSIRNFIMTTYALKDVGLTDFKMCVLGDDNIIAYKGDLTNQQVTQLENTFKCFGHESNIIIRDDLDLAEFCSMRFWNCDDTRVLGPKVFRALSKLTTKDPLMKPKDILPWLRGVVSSHKYNKFIPLFGRVIAKLGDAAGPGNIIRDKNWEQKILATKTHRTTQRTWEQFSKIYGLDQTEVELLLEESSIVPGGSLTGQLVALGCMVDGVPLYQEAVTYTEDLPYSGDQPILVGVETNPGPFVPRHSRTIGELVQLARQDVDEEKCCPVCEQVIKADQMRSLRKRAGVELIGVEANPGPKKRAVAGKKKKGAKPKQSSNQPKQGDGSWKDFAKTLVKSGLIAGGGALGGFVGGPLGATLGTKAGALVSKVTGMGDYKINSNSLMAGGTPQPLSFAEVKRGVRVKNREYLGDITGSVAFTATSFPINPGMGQTFPWLATLARNFEEFTMHGCIFEYRSTSADALNSTNTALGAMMMATTYNPYKAAYDDKLEMANSEYSCSGAPSRDLVHPIECDPAELVIKNLYLRYGEVPSAQDKRFYDLGTFYIATVGMQAAATIGELWVTYDVELRKPRFDGIGSSPFTYFISNSSYTNTDIFGPVQTTAKGNLAMTITATNGGYDTLNFPTWLSNGSFLVTIGWAGTSAACTMGTPTYTSCNVTTHTIFSGSLGTFNSVSSTTSAKVTYTAIINVTASGAKISYATATLPTSGATVFISVVSLDDSYFL